MIERGVEQKYNIHKIANLITIAGAFRIEYAKDCKNTEGVSRVEVCFTDCQREAKGQAGVLGSGTSCKRIDRETKDHKLKSKNIYPALKKLQNI